HHFRPRPIVGESSVARAEAGLGLQPGAVLQLPTDGWLGQYAPDADELEQDSQIDNTHAHTPTIASRRFWRHVGNAAKGMDREDRSSIPDFECVGRSAGGERTPAVTTISRCIGCATARCRRMTPAPC